MAVSLVSTGVQFPDSSIQTTAASGGTFVYLNSVALTAVTNIDTFNASFSSTYSMYLLVGENLAGSANASVRLRFVNSGTADAGTNYGDLSGAASIDGNTYRNYLLADTSTVCDLKGTSTTTKGSSFYTWLHKPNGTNPVYYYTSIQTPSSDTQYYSYGVAGSYSGTATSGIRLFTSTGTFAAQGKIYLYGIKTT